MLNPETVGKAAKQGEQMKVAPRKYDINEDAMQWDRQNTINQVQQMVMEEDRRRQMRQQYGGPPSIFGGVKNGGNF
jgi:hypothetical protein